MSCHPLRHSVAYLPKVARFLEIASYRASIYTEAYPTGSWLEVKGLASPDFMIEIEMQAHRSR